MNQQTAHIGHENDIGRIWWSILKSRKSPRHAGQIMFGAWNFRMDVMSKPISP
jgi:hypothetical protein